MLEKEINKVITPFINTTGKLGIEKIHDTFYDHHEVELFATAEEYINRLDEPHCAHAGTTKYDRIKVDSYDEIEVISTKHCPQCSKDEYSDDEFSVWQEKSSTSEVKQLLANRKYALDGIDYWEEYEDLADDIDDYFSAPIDWLREMLIY